MKKDFIVAIALSLFLLVLASFPLANRLAAWRAIAYYLIHPTAKSMFNAYQYAGYLDQSWQRLFEARHYMDFLYAEENKRELNALRQALVNKKEELNNRLGSEMRAMEESKMFPGWRIFSAEVNHRGLGPLAWVSRACVEKSTTDMAPYVPGLQFDLERAEFVLAGHSLAEAAPSPREACFELVTSPNHRASVYVESTNEIGLLVGTGLPDKVRLDYLSKDSKIERGDLVRTSAAGSVYPRGILVGEVIDIEDRSSTQLFGTVYVRPFLNLGRLNRLIVLAEHPLGK
ncbi:MAG: rod shape-determining protein MreC [Elusimicrobia bacterium]|nr:rod shape-determining protein MreC [Elusimicrobiota bacterium]